MVLKRESSALFTDFIAEADLVIAPTLLTTEVAYVLWKYQKFSKVPKRECLLPVAVILHAGLLTGVAESNCFIIRVNPYQPGRRCPAGRMRGFGMLGFHSLTHRLRRSSLSHRRGLSSLILDSATSPFDFAQNDIDGFYKYKD